MSISSVFQNVTSMRNATVPHVVIQGTDVGYDVKTETPFGDRAVLIERMAAPLPLSRHPWPPSHP